MFRILLVMLLSLHLSLPVVAGGRDDQRLVTGARHKNLRMVEMALSSGANIEAKDEIGRTSLMWAGFQGAPAMVAYLIAQGADINARDRAGRTGLMWAAIAGQGEVVRMLLRHGADVGLVDAKGTDAAGYASAESHFLVAEDLEEAAQASE